MSDEVKNIDEIKAEAEEVVATIATPDVVAPATEVKTDDRRVQNRRPTHGKNDRKPRREPRAKPEFDQKIIDIRRVTRVSSGGRRFSFSVSMVVGNRKGSVGVATGKAGDTALAIEKAYRAAKKSAIKVNLNKDMRISHDISAKFKSATVFLSIAKGRGIVAGSSARDVVELAGIKDINTKLHSPSKNKLNIAKATIKALSLVKKPRVNSEKTVETK